ncbi:MAG: phospholipid carrier-dependent glycosyltransferase [Solirubrobacteraceae bacterium]
MQRRLDWARRRGADPRAPLLALALIVALSFGARVVHLDQPCHSPCSTPAQHTLIFDEAFYVNAARAIDRIPQPASSPYVNSPAGKDPNAEHAQLAKIVIAGGIELFGDNPWGWRLGSVLFGLIAIIALYSLVRGAGGGQWLGVGAAGIMALDNLMLVHGRIATLDIYAVALMLVAGALYVRRRPLLAGIALGVGACTKIVAVYLLLALVLYEAVRLVQTWRDARARTRETKATRATKAKAPSAQSKASATQPKSRPPQRFRALGWTSGLGPLALCIVASVLVFFGLLWVMDLVVPAWDPGSHTVYGGNPFAHFAHMVSVAQALKTAGHPRGIASTPLQWLVDQKPINYARVSVNAAVAGRTVSSYNTIDFRGEINPFIIFVALPALVASAAAVWRSRDRVALVGACWSVGTFIPFVVQSDIAHRISYLFYMLIVMPGVYIMAARLFSPRYVPKLATVVWVGLVVFGFVALYPLRTLVGG